MQRFALIALSALTFAAALTSSGADDSSFDAKLRQRKSAHWAWQPLAPGALPDVKNSAWAKAPIDRFILSKLEQNGLAPAPPADRHALIRRVYFDLIGLPPTPAEVEAFVNDSSQQAFEKVVDHLLASEHFGERWARHWMDLVRYAETRGHEFEPKIPNAYQYRDYLIRAYNADVPYNQFVTEHIAGDLLPAPRVNPAHGYNESILATGFWFLGEEVHSPVDIRQDEADRLSNRIDTFTKTFLGLTVGCARCHDHKFDAISTKDFYALNGFLLSASYRQVPFEAMEANRKVAEKLAEFRARSTAALVPAVLSIERPTLNHLADYLMAARQVSLNSDADTSAIAAEKSLDAGLLRAWVDELAAAKKDANHPLNAFATIALDGAANKADRFAALCKPMVEGWRHQLESAHHAPDELIADFDAMPASQWHADGVAFGLGPVRAGQVLLADRSDAPLTVACRGAAQRDLAFHDIRSMNGNDGDYGALGNFHRAGQTVRTPTVTLKTGKVWYLIRGGMQAYAVVDSHLIIGGPLHGALLRDFPSHDPSRENRKPRKAQPKSAAKTDLTLDTPGESKAADKPEPRPDTVPWRWVLQDLSEYAGHRCHIELNPEPGEPLAVARVIDSEQNPTLDTPNEALLAALSDPGVQSVDALAAAYQKTFATAADRLSAGAIFRSTDARGQACLADYIVRRPDLFSPGGKLPTKVTDSAAKTLQTQSEIAAGQITESHFAMAMFDGVGVDEHVLVRGSAKNVGDSAPRQFLTAIAGFDQPAYPADTSGRLRLAADMLDAKDPFITRVMVNRVWHHLFGRGIVPTVDNLGALGQAPTHRELLDYLAEQFRTEQAWSVKKLIRSIVLSNAYQMSSKASPVAEQADPQNLTFSHMPIRRLEAEAIRDEMLAVSGRLDPTIGGPSIDVYLTQFMEGRGRPGGGPLDGAGRRSIYTKIRRNFLSPMMLAFDMPQPFACMGRRNVSNVPAQALILMNDPFVLLQANLWAKQILSDPKLTPAQRITVMYETALSREPKGDELSNATAFLDLQAQSYGLSAEQAATDARPWADLAHVMFNLKEFIFVE